MISYCTLQNYGIPLAVSLMVVAVLHLLINLESMNLAVAAAA
jgi:hypothetical protein